MFLNRDYNCCDPLQIESFNSQGVEDRVRRGKIDLCADLEDVRLDLNHLKMGSGSRLFFKRNFG